MINIIHDATGTNIPIRLVFNNPILEDMARAVEKLETMSDDVGRNEGTRTTVYI